MKKFLAIFFVSIYILSSTELRELAKLPEFVEHFKEHKQNDSSTSIFGFIVLHYSSGNKKDADYEKDMKLPFKTHDFSTFSVSIQDIPKTFELNIVQTKKLFTEKKQNFHYAESFVNPHLLALFQPPELI